MPLVVLIHQGDIVEGAGAAWWPDKHHRLVDAIAVDITTQDEITGRLDAPPSTQGSPSQLPSLSVTGPYSVPLMVALAISGGSICEPEANAPVLNSRYTGSAARLIQASM